MSELSSKIKNDIVFNNVYQAFSNKFSQFNYESDDDAVGIYEGELFIGRVFFVKDLNGIVRFIKLLVGRDADLELFGSYFKAELPAILFAKATDLYAKADLRLTTFEIYSLELSELALKTAKPRGGQHKN
jgi:hypothetical protein